MAPENSSKPKLSVIDTDTVYCRPRRKPKSIKTRTPADPQIPTEDYPPNRSTILDKFNVTKSSLKVFDHGTGSPRPEKRQRVEEESTELNMEGDKDKPVRSTILIQLLV